TPDRDGTPDECVPPIARRGAAGRHELPAIDHPRIGFVIAPSPCSPCLQALSFLPVSRRLSHAPLAAEDAHGPLRSHHPPRLASGRGAGNTWAESPWPPARRGQAPTYPAVWSAGHGMRAREVVHYC